MLVYSLARAARPHQWVKNLLLFVPILSSSQSLNEVLVIGLWIFVTLCMVSSSIYLINDIIDSSDDALHPIKSKRPVASGELSIPYAFIFALSLIATANILCIILKLPIQNLINLYFCYSLAYTVFIKKIFLLDVLSLAFFFSFRVFIGAIGFGLGSSIWLLSFIFTIFLSIACIKRLGELAIGFKSLKRYYSEDHKSTLEIISITSFILSLAILFLYFQTPKLNEVFEYASFLIFSIPIIVIWYMRMLKLSKQGKIPSDPVAFAIKDSQSIILFICLVLIYIIAYYGI